MESNVNFASAEVNGCAVVEMHAVAEMEDVGQRVGRFPSRGEVGGEIHMRIAAYAGC